LIQFRLIHKDIEIIDKENFWLFENEVISPQFSPYKQFFFWMFFFNACLLGWVGAKPIEYPYMYIGLVATIYYFVHFIIIMPGLTFLEIYALNLALKKKK